MTTTQASFVTLNEVRELSTLFSIVQDGARVRWLIDGGGIVAGVARHFVRDSVSAGFLDWNTDNVLDAYLRVSGTFEYFLPVRDALSLLSRGEFARD